MKARKSGQKKAKVGVGAAGIKAAIKRLRKHYGPVLKRLAS
jgi:hypothetical protein